MTFERLIEKYRKYDFIKVDDAVKIFEMCAKELLLKQRCNCAATFKEVWKNEPTEKRKLFAFGDYNLFIHTEEPKIGVCDKLHKDEEDFKRTLRVIYTWATFNNGELLIPKDVEKLIGKIKDRL